MTHLFARTKQQANIQDMARGNISVAHKVFATRVPHA